MSVTNDFWSNPPSNFLAGLSEAARAELLVCAKRRQLRKGQHIFRAGSRGENVYILERGRAKIYELSQSGKEVILWFCLPGEIFGLAEIPHGAPREVSAVASMDSEVLAVPRDHFKQFLLAHSDAAFSLIDLLSSRMRMLGALMLAMATEEVPPRVAKLLLGLMTRYRGACDLHERCDHHKIDLRLTHQEIADMSGTSRQSVSSLIVDWKQKGILFVHDHTIYIEDEPALKRLAGDTDEPIAKSGRPALQAEQLKVVSS